jgi:hypothetical protein
VGRTAAMAADAHRVATDFAEDRSQAAIRSPGDFAEGSSQAAVRSPGDFAEGSSQAAVRSPGDFAEGGSQAAVRSPGDLSAVAAGVTAAVIAGGVGVATEEDGTGEAGL